MFFGRGAARRTGLAESLRVACLKGSMTDDMRAKGGLKDYERRLKGGISAAISTGCEPVSGDGTLFTGSSIAALSYAAVYYN